MEYLNDVVKILGFGSNWWARFGRDPSDPIATQPRRVTTTPRACAADRDQAPLIVPGLIRFNGVGDFDPNFPGRALVRFLVLRLTFAYRGNRILLSERPEDRSQNTTRGRVRASDSASLTLTIRAGDQNNATDSVSQLREQQEACC